MFLFAAIAFPVVLLGLLLAMERVERPLNAANTHKAIEGFLDNAQPDEVNTLVNQGMAAALKQYSRRIRPAPGKHRAA